MTKLQKQDFAIGATWKFAGKRRMGVKAITPLLVAKAGLTEKAARQLAEHWVKSRSFQDLG